MIERRKNINNPLTLIKYFWGIPIIALLSIKYINPELQSIFLSFIGGYYLLLLWLTFRVFIFNPGVLYAPYNFRDEKNFMDAIKTSRNVEKRKINRNSDNK